MPKLHAPLRSPAGALVRAYAALTTPVIPNGFLELGEIYDDGVYGTYVSANGGTTDQVPDGHGVAVYGFDGVMIRSFGSAAGATSDGGFTNPSDVSVYNDEVYVTDFSADRVQVFGTTGNFLRKWGVNEPNGITVRDDRVYVSRQASHDDVEVFGTSGASIQVIGGGSGTGSDEMLDPEEVFISDDDFLYVIDGDNDRIQVWDTTGTHQLSWDRVNASANIKGLTGVNDEVYVTEILPSFGGTEVNVFNSTGGFLRVHSTADELYGMNTMNDVFEVGTTFGAFVNGNQGVIRAGRDLNRFI